MAERARQTPRWTATKPRKKGYLLLFILGLPFCILLLCCGGCLTSEFVSGIQRQRELLAEQQRAARIKSERDAQLLAEQNQRALEDGDSLFSDGKHAEAVAKYQAGYPAAGPRKGEVVKRCVEYHLKLSEKDAARTWIERGRADGVELSFDDQEAKDFSASVVRQREEQQARAKKEQEDELAKAAEKRKAEKEQSEEKLTLESSKGFVDVSILSAKVHRVDFDQFGQTLISDNPFLVLRILVGNGHSSKPFGFQGWQYHQSGVSLKDNIGNKYIMASWPNSKIKGTIDGETLYPKEGWNTNLVFMRPVAAAEYLILELPASNCGQEGVFRFKIEKEFWSR